MKCGPNGCGTGWNTGMSRLMTGTPDDSVARAAQALGPFSPFVMLNEMFSRGDFPNTSTATPRAESGGAMPLNITETDTHVLVRAMTPGFTKEQIDIEFEDAVLTIRAEGTPQPSSGPPADERSGPTEPAARSGSTEERVLRTEFATRTLVRRLRFTMPIDHARTQAELKDGVLTIRLAKVNEEPKGTKIRVY
jgi:HSP20 family molecular chaperone IbpA